MAKRQTGWRSWTPPANGRDDQQRIGAALADGVPISTLKKVQQTQPQRIQIRQRLSARRKGVVSSG